MSIFRLFSKFQPIITRQAFISTTAVVQESETPKKQKAVDPSRLRNVKHSVETSIRYIDSPSFKKAYGDDYIWTLYRRNFKGAFAPPTRKRCIRNNIVTNASPCPICRDEYLVVDYRNVKLLQQFISPYSGHIYSSKRTGVCQHQYEKLLIAIQKAKRYGLITYEVPFRSYDYTLYVPDKEIPTGEKKSD